MKKALASAFILCGYILDYNEKRNNKGGMQLDFVLRHSGNSKCVEVLINLLSYDLTSEDMDAIVEANSILKGDLKLTKTGEISVKFT